MTLGKRLAQLRGKNKKQEEVAKILGIARSTYGAYEQDKRDPDYEMLVKLAKLYNVSTDYLLGKSDSPQPSSQEVDYDPLEDLKQYMIDNNLQDMDFGFFNIDDWKKLKKDDIEEIKRHFEWVVEKAKQRENDEE